MIKALFTVTLALRTTTSQTLSIRGAMTPGPCSSCLKCFAAIQKKGFLDMMFYGSLAVYPTVKESCLWKKQRRSSPEAFNCDIRAQRGFLFDARQISLSSRLLDGAEVNRYHANPCCYDTPGPEGQLSFKIGFRLATRHRFRLGFQQIVQLLNFQTWKSESHPHKCTGFSLTWRTTVPVAYNPGERSSLRVSAGAIFTNKFIHDSPSVANGRIIPVREEFTSQRSLSGSLASVP
ncbi:hypothetical protein K438DRAFT_395289 [Mycena galopus ATCC 62051]|nr:hypothetical protein K438DRAFT_395289 [Mycena galopus ATCC 62051]